MRGFPGISLRKGSRRCWLRRGAIRDVQRLAQPKHAAQAGTVILFESWLRHEVPANPTVEERVSVSFNYACSGLTATTYLITATGQNTMTGFAYTIDQSNARVTTGLPAGWTGLSSNCWVLKRDGSC